MRLKENKMYFVPRINLNKGNQAMHSLHDECENSRRLKVKCSA